MSGILLNSPLRSAVRLGSRDARATLSQEKWPRLEGKHLQQREECIAVSESYMREKCIHSRGLSCATSSSTSITPVAVFVTLHQFRLTRSSSGKKRPRSSLSPCEPCNLSLSIAGDNTRLETGPTIPSLRAIITVS